MASHKHLQEEVPKVDTASTAVDDTILIEATNAHDVVGSPHVTKGLPESSNPSGGDATMTNVPAEASDTWKQIVGTSGGVGIKENVPVEACNKGKVLGTGGSRRFDLVPEIYDLDGYGAKVLECSGWQSKIQQWESLFPGWKLNPSTMQWYQVNNGHEALQGNAESISSYTGTLGRNQFMTRGYPYHMVFDPNYPGWYYDTDARGWKLLESYMSSLNDSQKAVQLASRSTMPISSMADSSRMNPIHTQSVSNPDISTSPRQGQTDSSKKASSPESKVGTSCGFGLQQILRIVGKVFRPKRSQQAKSDEETALPPPPAGVSLDNDLHKVEP